MFPSCQLITGTFQLFGLIIVKCHRRRKHGLHFFSYPYTEPYMSPTYCQFPYKKHFSPPAKIWKDMPSFLFIFLFSSYQMLFLRYLFSTFSLQRGDEDVLVLFSSFYPYIPGSHISRCEFRNEPFHNYFASYISFLQCSDTFRFFSAQLLFRYRKWPFFYPLAPSPSPSLSRFFY